jgi:mRNA-degrading endonuclease RelE of RelBE toxin-antitoxin system
MLPKELLERIDRKIEALAEDPWPSRCKKLAGTRYECLHRVRVGGWRISYAVETSRPIVLTLEMAPG